MIRALACVLLVGCGCPMADKPDYPVYSVITDMGDAGSVDAGTETDSAPDAPAYRCACRVAGRCVPYCPDASND